MSLTDFYMEILLQVSFWITMAVVLVCCGCIGWLAMRPILLLCELFQRRRGYRRLRLVPPPARRTTPEATR